MQRAPSAADLREAVDEAFAGLPERYLGLPEGATSTVQVRLTDQGRVFEVCATAHGVRVRVGASIRPDVVITTDAQTWLDIRAGELSGIEAFGAHRLAVRGDLDRAVGFEGLFRLPDDRPPLVRVHDVAVDGCTLNVMTTGTGPAVVLIHGLGATKASFFDAAATLARDGFTVHAVDLPGFGSSSKPLLAPYTASWMAARILDLLDRLEIERAHLVGNSMGGRISLEIGLRAPERAAGLVLLCPAVAFVKRPWLGLVRVLRPELGVLPHQFSRGRIRAQLFDMLSDPSQLDPAVADVAVDEFQRVYHSAAARAAFLKAARNIYLDRPFGRGGFYPRLAGLAPPALFVWGADDPLIPAAFGRHVGRWLPKAEQIVLDRTGHVPQIEHPAQTSGLIHRFLRRVDALRPAHVPRHQEAA